VKVTIMTDNEIPLKTTKKSHNIQVEISKECKRKNYIKAGYNGETHIKIIST